MHATSPKQGTVTASIIGVIGVLEGIAGITFLPHPWDYAFCAAAFGAAIVVLYTWYGGRPGVIVGYRKDFGPSLLDELAGTTRVWMMLYTGSVITVEDFWRLHPGPITLVLTHPDAPVLEAIHNSSRSLGLEKLKEDIRAATRIARTHRADVRWSRWSFPGALIIGNPRSPGEGWARLESALAGVPVADRISVKVFEKRNRKLYEQLRDSFQAAYDNAEAPPDSL